MQGLIEAINATEDIEPRRIYADFLEERGYADAAAIWLKINELGKVPRDYSHNRNRLLDGYHWFHCPHESLSIAAFNVGKLVVHVPKAYPTRFAALFALVEAIQTHKGLAREVGLI